MEKKYITELVKQWTEDNIDISEQYQKWKMFLKTNGYLMSYKEVYQMDLEYLQSNKDHKFFNEETNEWDVKSLIAVDNDIEKINNNLFFVHRQQYIDKDDIKSFYKQEHTILAVKQAMNDLNISNNGFNRFQALLTILKNDFDWARLYLCTDIDKTKQQILYCINDVLKLINHSIYDGSIQLWIPNHNMWSDEEDDHYCELIKFGGYEVLSNGQQILDSDVIILKNEESIHTLDYFTYQNNDEFCNYIEDVFSFYRKDVSDVDDSDYTYEISEKINKIINQYWMNTFEFDYAEYYLHN